ncbi:hypothetical protein Cgig2_000179 [Carnegiea gigantea]|uniref:Crossover junction endonuclease MUS81 n=1 Tax=Carnegiea gigantea TaxID=171969 RepID=A0A9Q1KM96_9CARY|nr:hypothetical protein Cgig2_000179 [Carnegiea gigantea]
MGSEQRAVCPENDALVEFMRKWWKEMEEKRPKYYTENTQRNIQRAFSNVCHCKTPIKTLKDFQNIKGVGKWFVKHMRDFFITDSGDSRGDNLPKEELRFISDLSREIEKGREYIHKQELIDAADASGLARVPIAPEKGRGKLGNSGSSKREWYSGWSAMAKLVDKGLVVKTSCPAKYKLSDAGRQAAYECLLRSNMLDSSSHSINRKELSDSEKQDVDNLEFVSLESAEEVALASVNLIRKDTRDNHPMECLERRQIEFYSGPESYWRSSKISAFVEELATMRSDSADASSFDSLEEDQPNVESRMHSVNFRSSTSVDTCAASLAPCTSYDNCVEKMSHFGVHAIKNALRMPPLGLLEKFEDIYKVILILDDRENFVRSKSRNIIDNIRDQYKIQIEVRRLPVGDGIWVARHRHKCMEYVLDFIVERKNVDDLRCSIRDNRYKDQKLRLLIFYSYVSNILGPSGVTIFSSNLKCSRIQFRRTGLQKIIYMVEGDPNVCEATESIKTACFTTEILEGFDVQRTSSLADTLKRYGYLTLAINDYYKSSCEGGRRSTNSCPEYRDFIRKCEDLDKMTVSDVFASQLMQDGDTHAQEELLMKRSKNVINAAASKNVFRLVWQS